MAGSSRSPQGSDRQTVSPRRRSLAGRLRRDQSGMAAVEMALVAVPFFALLGGIMEGALNFWSTQVLETAVHEASRQIYTGQFQEAQATGGVPAGQHADKFRDIVCNEVRVLLKCDELKVDVRTYTSFPKRVQSPIIKDAQSNGTLDPTFGAYQAPGPNQIVVVRAAVKIGVIFALMDANKTNLTPSTRVVMASAAFRTEPFPVAANP